MRGIAPLFVTVAHAQNWHGKLRINAALFLQVGEGGRTVFPRIGAGVDPTPGSAVFWYLPPAIFACEFFTVITRKYL